MSATFEPSASITALQQRACLLRKLREYFFSHNVLEVDVPVIAKHAVSDVHLSSLEVKVGNQSQYLQTSPEYFMKRLLAAGSGSIYTVTKAFRNDENGSRHRPEFSMLEWYRLGFDDRQLMQDVINLMAFIGVNTVIERVSYADVFQQYTNMNPHQASESDLGRYCWNKFQVDWPNSHKETWLDVIFSQEIEPHLQQPILVYDFPECQSALAKVMPNQHGHQVAKRFELYWQGIELANGYWELTDVHEQKERFLLDNVSRKNLGLNAVEPDPYFLSALEHGLPECAGIALGIDRLLMCLMKTKNIREVMTFADG